jgi:hypothetical protein
LLAAAAEGSVAGDSGAAGADDSVGEGDCAGAGDGAFERGFFDGESAVLVSSERAAAVGSGPAAHPVRARESTKVPTPRVSRVRWSSIEG